MGEVEHNESGPPQCVYTEREVRCPNNARKGSNYCDQHSGRVYVGSGGRAPFLKNFWKYWAPSK
jgi:hypothetical protein